METIRTCIGPPLQDSLSRLLGTQNPDMINEALTLYRSKYSTTGLYENVIYPGVPGMLAALVKQDCTLHLVTSKPVVYASKILEYFSILCRFKGLYGSSLEGGNSEKTELIQEALEDQSIDPSLAIMIGDRKHDIEGARANSVGTIGVTWGFGTKQELITASPRFLVDHPSEIPGVVLSL